MISRSQAGYYKGAYEGTLERERVLLSEAIDTEELHASLIDLIDKTQSCTSGLSFGECLAEIKRRLGK